VLRKMGRIAPRQPPPIFDPTRGLRTRPYPPDSAVTQIWRVLRAGRIAVAGAHTADAEDLTVFAQEMASRLDVFKLVLLDRQALDSPELGVEFASANNFGKAWIVEPPKGVGA
jgi:hypothetical protein